MAYDVYTGIDDSVPANLSIFSLPAEDGEVPCVIIERDQLVSPGAHENGIARSSWGLRGDRDPTVDEVKAALAAHFGYAEVHPRGDVMFSFRLQGLRYNIGGDVWADARNERRGW